MGYFCAIEIPDKTVQALDQYDLSCLQDKNIKTQRRSDLHITLSYMGDLSKDTARKLQDTLHDIQIPRFEVETKGGCYFPPGTGYRNHFFCAQNVLMPELADLKSAIDQICTSIGVTSARPEKHYTPHITLARTDHALESETVEHFLTQNQGVTLPSFPVTSFGLFQSLPPRPYIKIEEYMFDKPI